MNKCAVVFLLIVFILTLLTPAGFLLCSCFEYSFELTGASAFVIVLSFLSVFLVVFSFVCQSAFTGRTIRILSALVAPMSLINAAFMILAEPHIPVIVCAWLSALCACVMAFRFGKPLSLKIITLAVSFLLILPIVFLSVISAIFGNLSQNTVIRTIESPDGKYIARIIESDQGALGGNTIVEVTEKGIDLLLFKIEKAPKTVYRGEWLEYRTIRLSWSGNSRLMINSAEYDIRKTE